MSGKTIVEYFSEHERYKCGYCGSSDTNYSHGMWAHSMTVQDYQDLIDRGWRRSGGYVYKPSMQQTCCPQYPIRCNALDFKLSRSQKKVIKRVNKFLNTGVKPGAKGTDDLDGPEAIGMDIGVKEYIPKEPKIKASGLGSDIDTSKLSSKPAVIKSNVKPSANVKASDVKGTDKKDCDTSGVKAMKSHRPGQGVDPSKPKCIKAKLRRRQAWQEKHPGSQLSTKTSQEAKSLEDHLSDIDTNPALKLEVRLTRRNHPQSREFEERFVEAYNVYKEYQMEIHKDSAEECDQRSYTRFLVDSPLKAESHEGGFPEGFGSFHQQYLLDGRVIAVGVVDILPYCVSSVYLYYHPDYHFLSLGTYSALRELAFTRHLHTMEPELKYYYMGFYIHSCPKMRYKGAYSPSYLVCPETYGWFPIEECTPKLDVNKYSRFASSGQVDPQSELELPHFLVLFARQAMPYAMYRMLNPEAEDEEEVRQYGTFVGNMLAKRMLLYRS